MHVLQLQPFWQVVANGRQMNPAAVSESGWCGFSSVELMQRLGAKRFLLDAMPKHELAVLFSYPFLKAVNTSSKFAS